MKYVRIIFSSSFGGCLGFAVFRFGSQGDWAMMALALSLFFGVFYITLWVIECGEK